MRSKLYLPLMGTLEHLEAVYYISCLYQSMHDPPLSAYDAGLNVLMHMLSAKDLGLTFDKIEPEIVAYSDASWSQVPAPFGGHVVLYGGVPVPFSALKTKNSQ